MCTPHGPQTRVFGRGLYMERLTVGRTRSMDARMQLPPYYAKIKLFLPLKARTHHVYLRKEESASLFLPLTAETHQLHLRTQGSESILRKNDSSPNSWDPPAISSHTRKYLLIPLTTGTYPVEPYVGLSVWSRTCTYILVDLSLQR